MTRARLAKDLSSLVDRAGRQIWRGKLASSLRWGLWICTGLLALVVAYNVFFPRLPLSLSMAIALLPLFGTSLWTLIRQRPDRLFAAKRADQWAAADSLLLATWESLSKRDHREAAIMPVLLERARRQLPHWQAKLASGSAQHESRSSGLPLMAALCLLGVVGYQQLSAPVAATSLTEGHRQVTMPAGSQLAAAIAQTDVLVDSPATPPSVGKPSAQQERAAGKDGPAGPDAAPNHPVAQPPADGQAVADAVYPPADEALRSTQADTAQSNAVRITASGVEGEAGAVEDDTPEATGTASAEPTQDEHADGSRSPVADLAIGRAATAQSHFGDREHGQSLQTGDDRRAAATTPSLTEIRAQMPRHLQLSSQRRPQERQVVARYMQLLAQDKPQ